MADADDHDNERMAVSMDQDFEIDIDGEGDSDENDAVFQGEGNEEEFEDDGEENPEELSEAEVVQRILDLGNEALQNLGVEERIEDVAVFFTDAFYIQFFEAAFPNFDFGSLEEAQTEEEMADNIQALIELLSQHILKFDLDHIRGQDIVEGNPFQCMNLLQLVKEISVTLARNPDESGEGEEDDEGEEQEGEPDDQAEEIQNWQQRRGGTSADQVAGQHSAGDVEDFDDDEDQLGEGEDDDQVQDISERVSIALEEGEKDELDGDDDDEIDGDPEFEAGDGLDMDNAEGDDDGLDDMDDDGEGEVDSDVDAQEFLNRQHVINDMIDADLDGDEEIQPQEQASDSDDGLDQQEAPRAKNKMEMNEELDEDDMEGEEGEGLDDFENMVMPADLMAAAQEMGMDLEPAQIKQLQAYLAQQQQEGLPDEDDRFEEVEISDDPDEPEETDNIPKQILDDDEDEFEDGENEIEGDEDDEHYALQNQMAGLEDDGEGEEDDEDDEDKDEENGDMALDLNELSEDQRQMLLAYLQEEQAKNPEQFSFPKEKLEQLLMNNKMPQGDDDDDEDEDPDNADVYDDQQQEEYEDQMDEGADLDHEEGDDQEEVAIDDQQMFHAHQAHKRSHKKMKEMGRSQEELEGADDELNIEGGEQNIEEDDNMIEDYADQEALQGNDEQFEEFYEEEEEEEDDVVDGEEPQQFTQEQIQEILQMKQQEQMQQQYQLEDEDDEEEGDDDELDENQVAQHISQEEMDMLNQNDQEGDSEVEGIVQQEGEGDDEDQGEELPEDEAMEMAQQQAMLAAQQEAEAQAYYQQQQEMAEAHAQAQMLAQKPKKKKVKQVAIQGVPQGPSSRYSQSRKKQRQPQAQQQAAEQEQMQLQQLQQEQLEQLQQLIAENPEQFQDDQNMDPNLLQQIILAQQQIAAAQQQPPSQQQSSQKPSTSAQKMSAHKSSQRQIKQGVIRPRPSTAKTATTGPRTSMNSYKQFILQQQSAQRQNANGMRGPPPVVVAQPKRARPATARKPSVTHKRKSQSKLGDKKIKGTSSQRQLPQYQQEQSAQPAPQLLPEEVVSQLSEEQLHHILQQQRDYMKNASKQQPRQPAKRVRSAKRTTAMLTVQDNQIPSSRTSQKLKTASQIYSQTPAIFNSLGSGRRRATQQRAMTIQAMPKRKSGRQGRRKVQPGQGILLNNYFPALEGGNRAPSSQEEAEHLAALAHQQQQQAMLMQGQDQQIINEAPPEEEEGESQDLVNSRNTQHHHNQIQQNSNMAAVSQEEIDLQNAEIQMQLAQQEQAALDSQQIDSDDGMPPNLQNVGQDVELTEEQLAQLLQNADQLSPDQQKQLQSLLKKRWKKELKNQKQMQYNNIYNILTENVAKAKLRLASLANKNQPGESPGVASKKARKEDEDTLERILRQKREYEALLRAHEHEQQTKRNKRINEQTRLERQVSREVKLKQIRQKRFEEELVNQQKSLMYKRNAQQVRLCEKVYRLASNLEKNKLLEEKREYLESQEQKKTQKKQMVDAIETFYKDKIIMLKERIDNERFERRIAKQAQTEALGRMRQDLNWQKRAEIQKYLAVLKQEDQKYDMQSSNLAKLEREIIKLYKKH